MQTALSIIENLLRQFISSNTKMIDELYESMAGSQTRRNLTDGLNNLLSLCSAFGKTYVVVDALDECSPDQRKLLLPIFRSFQNSSIKVFVTSRQHVQDVERAFGGQARIEIKATESDLRSYVTNQIEKDEDLAELLTDDLKMKIVDNTAGGADGM
jgi:hypothetical protein